MLDGSGVNAIPGSIPALNFRSLYKNKKNTGSQMLHSQKKKILMHQNIISNKIPFQNMKTEKKTNFYKI